MILPANHSTLRQSSRGGRTPVLSLKEQQDVVVAIDMMTSEGGGWSMVQLSRALGKSDPYLNVALRTLREGRGGISREVFAHLLRLFEGEAPAPVSPGRATISARPEVQEAMRLEIGSPAPSREQERAPAATRRAESALDVADQGAETLRSLMRRLEEQKKQFATKWTVGGFEHLIARTGALLGEFERMSEKAF